MEREILTIREMADYLQVNERTLYRLANKGAEPAFRVASARWFRKRDIDNWIAEQSQISHPEDAANP